MRLFSSRLTAAVVPLLALVSAGGQAHAAVQPGVLHVSSVGTIVNTYHGAAAGGKAIRAADTAPAIRPDAPPLPGSPATSYAAPSAAPLPPATAAPSPDAASADYLRGLQRALPAHGYQPGPETGRLDPATEAAILAYQRDAGLTPDARSPMALKRTVDSVYFARPAVMARGAVPGGVAGAPGSVAWVQRRLGAKGFPTGPADGRMGPGTQAAIARFQSTNGLPPTGRIDGRLIDLLEH